MSSPNDGILIKSFKYFLRIQFILFLITASTAQSQTNIAGTAQVSLVAGPEACNGFCATVNVLVDVTGLSGTGGDAGLNAFVLALNLDRGEAYASSFPGGDLDWLFFATNRDVTRVRGRLILVGIAAEPIAPNRQYLAASIILCGSVGNVTLSLDSSESSLGSRVVEGQGADSIALAEPGPLTVLIPGSIPFQWGTALESWRLEDPVYDLEPPFWLIDVRDLVGQVKCGLP